MAQAGRSLFETIQSEGRRVLGLIQSEISDLEGQLAELRAQAEQWAATLERRTRPGSASSPKTAGQRKAGARKKKAATKRPRRKSPEVDWDAVLKRLPDSFTMADVAKKTPKLKPYPRARVMAVARWSRSKLVRKVAPGKYKKTARRKSKRAA